MNPIPPWAWIERSQAADGRIRAQRLGRGRGDRPALVALGDAPGGEERQRPAELELHQRRRERVRDGLIGADRLPELLALLHVADGELERPPADAARLERERRQRAGTEPRHELRAREPPTGRPARDDAERPRHVVRLQQLALGALELPDRVASDDGDARRGVEVGDERAGRERPARLSLGDLGLEVRRQGREHHGHGRPVRRVRERPPHLLEQDRLLEEAEAGAAVLLGDRDAGPAELGELLPGRLRDSRRGTRAPASRSSSCSGVNAKSISATSAGRARARR